MPNQQELEDFEDQFEAVCPNCGNTTIFSEKCHELACENGYIDESDEDFCVEGSIMVPCSECGGTGFITWCPACGADLTAKKLS